MVTHSSILAWRIPWTEEPGRLQSMGLQELDTTQLLNHHHHCVLTTILLIVLDLFLQLLLFPSSFVLFYCDVMFRSLFLLCVRNYCGFLVCSYHEISIQQYINKIVLSCCLLISDAFPTSCIRALLFSHLLVLISYLCTGDFLPLLCVCLYR